MTSWSSLVQQRAQRFSHVPPLDMAERIATICIEAIVADLNIQLAEKHGDFTSYPMIHTTDAINTIDAHGKCIDLGIYAPVMIQVAREMLSHDRRQRSPAQKFSSNQTHGLEQLSQLLTEQETIRTMEIFIGRFEQLNTIGLGSPEALYEYILGKTSEITQDCLTKKPSRPMDDPSKGSTASGRGGK